MLNQNQFFITVYSLNNLSGVLSEGCPSPRLALGLTLQVCSLGFGPQTSRFINSRLTLVLSARCFSKVTSII